VTVAKDTDEQSSVVLGVVVAPGLAEDVRARIAADLADDLRDSYGTVEWQAELAVDRLVVPPVPTTEILDAARRKLLDRDWDIAVIVTDLPLRRAGRPVSRHVSRTYGIAVVSLPALGAIHLRPRLRRTLLDLVGELVGDAAGTPDRSGRGRWRTDLLRELATDVEERPGGLRFLFVPDVLFSLSGCWRGWCGRTGRGSSPPDCTERSSQHSQPVPTVSSRLTSGRSRTPWAGRV
jgi:hypothetical protein